MKWGLSGQPTKCRYCRYLAPKGRCHGNHFLAFYIWRAHWRHLANTTQPSVCGGDAALCEITLTTCQYYKCTDYTDALAKKCCMCTLQSWKLHALSTNDNARFVYELNDFSCRQKVISDATVWTEIGKQKLTNYHALHAWRNFHPNSQLAHQEVKWLCCCCGYSCSLCHNNIGNNSSAFLWNPKVTQKLDIMASKINDNQDVSVYLSVKRAFSVVDNQQEAFCICPTSWILDGLTGWVWLSDVHITLLYTAHTHTYSPVTLPSYITPRGKSRCCNPAHKFTSLSQIHKTRHPSLENQCKNTVFRRSGLKPAPGKRIVQNDAVAACNFTVAGVMLAATLIKYRVPQKRRIWLSYEII